MPLPDDFASESLYAPDAWFVHDLVSVDAERIEAVTDTTRLGHLVAAQRPWPGHPKHVPGAVVVQITGTLGQLHSVYGMGLRPSEGWVGFGTHVHSAKFSGLGVIGPAMRLVAEVTRKRTLRGTVFVDYTFTFSQDERTLYVSKQTAAWRQTEHRGLLPD